MADINFTVHDNSEKVRAEFERKVQNALDAIGMTAETYAKKDCPVDTGRLRGSITYATAQKHTSGQNPAKPSDYTAKGTAESGAVYIGTNVEYAPKIELNDMPHTVGRAHFLRDAAAQHSDEYKKITEASLKS